MIAKVIFDYDAEQADELSLKVGDIVQNVDQQDGGWWEGELNGKTGMFPENFVEIIKETSPMSPVPTPTHRSGTKKARVIFQYDPEQPDELALEVGDIIDILEDGDDGWWKGKLRGNSGMFPSNFVELIKEEPKPSLPSLPEQLEPGKYN